MHFRIGVFLLTLLFAGCVGAGKFKRLEEEKTKGETEWTSSRQKLEASNEALIKRNEVASNELIHQNTLLSELLNDKIELEKDVALLKDRIAALSSESKSLEDGLNEELQRKNENLKAKETKLNGMINWYLQQEAVLKNISTELGASLSEYKDDQIDWLIVNDHLDIVIFQEFLFQNQQSMTASATRALEKVGKILTDYPSLQILIEGHSDNTVNSVKDVLAVSISKAVSVGAFLLEEAGINGNQVTIAGKGGYDPKVSNQTPAGRTMNNRVEIIVRPSLDRLLSFLEEE